MVSAVQPGGGSASLDGVSCASTEFCVAVGGHENGSGVEVPLAEEWNGSTWSRQAIPNPAGAEGADLTGVSCSEVSFCEAVGYYQNSAGVELPLAEGWNGSKWVAQPTPESGSELRAVSCSSSTFCEAVGYFTIPVYGTVSVADTWNGSIWIAQPYVNPGSENFQLNGVSCVSGSTCQAVGLYENSFGRYSPLAERWNGSSWVVEPIPSPSDAQTADLLGVSCATSSSCLAVGDYENVSGSYLSLAERWNGTKWTAQYSRNPSGGQYIALFAGSCAGRSCEAVGNFFNSSHQWRPLA